MGSWGFNTVQSGTFEGPLKIRKGNKSKMSSFKQVKRSRGKVLSIWHFSPILRASDEWLSLHVFVYSRVSLYLVGAIVYVYLPGLASSLQLMISQWTSLWRKYSLWKWPTSQHFFASEGWGSLQPFRYLDHWMIPPVLALVRRNCYTGGSLQPYLYLDDWITKGHF